MALRYLILVDQGLRSDLAVSQMAARTGLSNHFALGSAHILTSGPSKPLTFPSGAVIGDLFHKHGVGPALRSLGEGDASAIDQAPPVVLSRQYWGAFVAIWRARGQLHVLRDPSGAMPCYFARCGQLFGFASDVELLVSAGLIRPSVDWRQVARALYANDLPLEETALRGVSELLAGTMATVTDERIETTAFWSPWDHVAQDPAMSPQAHAERLRRAVENVGRSWGSTHNKALLAVSGGLDSSIMAAVLKGAIDMEAFTIATADPRGDEESYARLLCEALGISLTSSRYALADVDIRTSSFAHLPRPGGRTQSLGFDAALLRVAEEARADAFYTGSGGDNVFHFSHSARPLVDQFLTHGISSELLETWRNICALTGASGWEVLRHALRVPGRGRGYQWTFDHEFLASDVREALVQQPPDHDWLNGPANALPGKAAHVAMILRAQHYLHGYDRMLPFTAVAPLLSQPVIETCLAIPSWHASRGGVDRSVARSAFEGRVPQAILQRRFKGGPDGFAVEILRTNLPQVKERLLGGHLARQHIIDLDAVERALEPTRLATRTEYVRLLLLLDTEAWIEKWQAAAPKIMSRRAWG